MQLCRSVIYTCISLFHSLVLPDLHGVSKPGDSLALDLGVGIVAFITIEQHYLQKLWWGSLRIPSRNLFRKSYGDNKCPRHDVACFVHSMILYLNLEEQALK